MDNVVKVPDQSEDIINKKEAEIPMVGQNRIAQFYELDNNDCVIRGSPGLKQHRKPKYARNPLIFHSRMNGCSYKS